MSGREEFEFANDVRLALAQRAPKGAWMLMMGILLILTVGFFWAKWAVIEEVTKGNGRVIPSSQLQVVQTLERGIVKAILVREGDLVSKGQVLMRIDDTRVASQLGELQQRRGALRAEIARLKAETALATKFLPSSNLQKEAGNAVFAQGQAFLARRAKLNEDLTVRRQQLVQKTQESLEFKARADKLAASLKLFERELVLTDDMRKNGSVPEIEFLRLKRQVINQRGELEIVKMAIPRAKAAIVEARSQIENIKAGYRTKAGERLASARGELAVINESLKAAKQRVAGAILRAPVRGIVNKLNITTIGAIAQPGQDIIQIVPRDDKLFIEARVRPQDVAFIRKDQAASVKLTAYDYLIYGALDGKVERISADTIADARGENFYRVIVRITQSYIEHKGKRLPILPGMVASVDILTGKRTVLDYLLKPIRRVRHEALRER